MLGDKRADGWLVGSGDLNRQVDVFSGVVAEIPTCMHRFSRALSSYAMHDAIDG